MPEIVIQIIQVCVIPLLGILTKYLVDYLTAKRNEINSKTDNETAQKYTAEVGGKIPIIKNIDIDYDAAPAQLKYVTDILANATGTFGFYNESLASVEAGDCFDNAMVDIFLGNQTPEEAFQTVQDFYEENVWE